MVRREESKFLGSKIPIRTYKRLIMHSDNTGRKIKYIVKDALDSYLKTNISKQFHNGEKDGSKEN